MNVRKIFPEAIATAHCHSFTNSERERLLHAEYEPDGDFLISKDLYILDTVPLLKDWIEDQIKLFANNVLCTDQKFRITQSWCIVHAGRPHRLYSHRHSNSIISGSFYVEAPEGTTGLTFHRFSEEKSTQFPLIEYEKNIANYLLPQWLSTTETIDVISNQLNMFPSNMLHSVNGESKTRRVVLAFNTWFEGSFGNKRDLTYVL